MSDLTVEELRWDFSVFDAARERGESVFLRTPEEDLTYTEVARLVADRIASFERPAPGRPHVLVARNDLASIVEILACLELEVPLVLLHPGLTELEQKALREEIAAKRDPLPEGAAVVVFTSGTTGRAKPAVLTRRALAESARSSDANIGLAPGDVWLLSISPARIGGFSILTRSLRARSAVALGGHFSPEGFLSEVESMKVTLASIVPTMLVQILKTFPERKAPATLRALLLGGASASDAWLARARAAAWPVIATYGMTETASNVTTTPYAERYSGVVGSGRVNKFAEVRVENGHILVRGPMRMTGYWGEPPLVPEAWHDTGDIGYFDEAGYLHVEARRSDLILSGGNNVYPLEVEAALESLPGIREALVTGLPDDVWGAVVTALLVPEKGPLPPEVIVEGLSGRLAAYKSPRRIAWVEALPVNPGGKLCRRPDVLEGLRLETLHYRKRRRDQE